MSWCATCYAQLEFVTNATSNTEANQAFENAADVWSNEFSDDITVHLRYGFSNLDNGTLSSASVGTKRYDYVDFWNAIGDDVTSADDFTMFNALPTGTSFSIYTNQTLEAAGSQHEVPYVDNDGGSNNSTVTLTTANAKAIGLLFVDAPVVDGLVLFNSDFDWDFDVTDGIDENHVDFFGVAVHEIGHALGFKSGVDELEAYGAGQYSDNELAFVTSLDFVRFSNESEIAGADLDWTADSRAKYLSIDGGLTPAVGGGSDWSTGAVYGDGEQASHWKDGMGLGAMGPTSDFGTMASISGVDLVTLDVIGYDRGGLAVPEPGSVAGWLLLGGLMMRRRIRRLDASY